MAVRALIHSQRALAGKKYAAQRGARQSGPSIQAYMRRDFGVRHDGRERRQKEKLDLAKRDRRKQIKTVEIKRLHYHRPNPPTVVGTPADSCPNRPRKPRHQGRAQPVRRG